MEGGDLATQMHRVNAERYAKFWLEPISLAATVGFRSGELTDLHGIVRESRVLLIWRWDEHFSR